jgi:hypothetical protein
MYDEVREARQETVPAVRIDSVLMPRPGLRVDVMKIDVEGAEAAVLAGARRLLTRDKPALILEVATPQAAAPFEVWMTSLGYVFLAIDGEAGQLASVTRLGGGGPGIENYIAASPQTVSMHWANSECGLALVDTIIRPMHRFPSWRCCRQQIWPSRPPAVALPPWLAVAQDPKRRRRTPPRSSDCPRVSKLKQKTSDLLARVKRRDEQIEQQTRQTR